MSTKKGVYKILNDEGAICNVDTVTQGVKTYGPVWAAICESKLTGTALEATVDRYQYKTMDGEPIDSAATGVVIKIQNQIEAFLPFSKCSLTDSNDDNMNKRIAVVVESFDPFSLSLVTSEIRVADDDFDIDNINKTLSLIGRANEEGKYVRGIIVGEKISYSSNRRSAYLLSINGLEGFLPCIETFFPYIDDVQKVIGHHVLAGVEEICIKKLSIVLSMKPPYENLINNLPAPAIQKKTKGLVYHVDVQNAYLLLPQRMLGVLPLRLYPNKEYSYWLNLTGNLVECVPFRKQHWNTTMGDYRYLTALYG